MSTEHNRDDFDSPWKDVLERFFEPFLRLLFPTVHAGIDWSRGCEFFDKELERVARDAELGRRLADKLVKVYRLNGEESWVLVHVEVQRNVDPELPERMYVYNYRIYDRYGRQVASLAVLGDEDPTWRPSSFGYDLWGTRPSLEFPPVKLLDWEARWQQLEQDPNPFAVVVMAHLKAIRTRQDAQGRADWKLTLFRGLYERGYERDEIIALFKFLDWVMRLPEELEQKFVRDVEAFERERQMPYVTSIERIGKERGRQEGIQRSILGFLKARFEEVPGPVVERVQAIHDVDVLDALTQKAATVASLQEFEQALPSSE